jgi:hypothetical protein
MKWFNWKSDPKPSVRNSRPPGRPTNVVRSFLQALTTTSKKHKQQTSGKKSRVAAIDKQKQIKAEKENNKQLRNWKKAGYGLEGVAAVSKAVKKDRVAGHAKRIAERLKAAKTPVSKKPKGSNTKARIKAATDGQAPLPIQKQLQNKKVFNFPEEQMTSITSHNLPKGLLAAATEILQENRVPPTGTGNKSAESPHSDTYHVVVGGRVISSHSSLKDTENIRRGLEKDGVPHKVIMGASGKQGKVVHVHEQAEDDNSQYWVNIDESEINESNRFLVEKSVPKGFYVRHNDDEIHQRIDRLGHGTIYSGPHKTYAGALKHAINSYEYMDNKTLADPGYRKSKGRADYSKLHKIEYHHGDGNWSSTDGAGITKPWDSSHPDIDRVNPEKHRGVGFWKALGRVARHDSGEAIGHVAAQALGGATVGAIAGGAHGAALGAGAIGGLVAAGEAISKIRKARWLTDKSRANRTVSESLGSKLMVKAAEMDRLAGRKSSRKELLTKAEALRARWAKKKNAKNANVEVSGDKEPDNDKDDVHESRRTEVLKKFNDHSKKMARQVVGNDPSRIPEAIKKFDSDKGVYTPSRKLLGANRIKEQFDPELQEEGLRTVVNYLSGRRDKVTKAYTRHVKDQDSYHRTQFDKAHGGAESLRHATNDMFKLTNSPGGIRSDYQRGFEDGADRAYDVGLDHHEKALKKMTRHSAARQHYLGKEIDVLKKGARGLPRMGTAKEEYEPLDEAKKVRLVPGGSKEERRKNTKAFRAAKAGKQVLATKKAKIAKKAESKPATPAPEEKSWSGKSGWVGREQTQKLHAIKDQDVKQKAAKWLMDKSNHLPDLSGKDLHNWAVDKFSPKKTISLAGKTK